MPAFASRLLLLAVAAAMLAGLVSVYVNRRAGDANGPMPGAARPASVPVVTAPVERKPLAVEVEALGTARANEAVEVTSKAANTVTAVRFREGEWVRAGQVLVELDSAQARADRAAAEAALVESRAAFLRSRDLYTQQALSQAQLEQIEATLKANEARVASAQARLADTVIRAPFAGRIGLRRVSVGALINPGTVITTLDDTATMKLDFDVPETFLAVLKPGLDITASSVAYPGRVFEGQIDTVDSRVDPVSRSVKVRARLPNPEGLLRPGMFLTVVVSRDPTPGLVVPEQALVPERGRVYVFTVADGQAVRREVSIGRRRPGEVEITTGLDEGERVVTEGTQRVRDGSAVNEQRAPAPATAG